MCSNNVPEDWVLAREGIKLLLNNSIEEAEKLFSEKKDNIQMAAGYCFVTFMNALMTFEDEKLEEALQTLKDIEKRCVQDIGWLKSVKNKVFGTFGYGELESATRLEEQIILADSQVCVALLTFLQQDLSSYVKGGWVLRKAWKVYQHTYSQILTLYNKTFGHHSPVPGSLFPSWQVVTKSLSSNSIASQSDWSVPNTPSATPSNSYSSPWSFFTSLSFTSGQAEPSISPETVARLMSAVSFGYGIFQLCVSMLPPSLLKLIHFLGFEGDRKIGVSALMFSKEGSDMRAPLATLALLWYHTIVRPFYALDGSNVQAGVTAAQSLIDESCVEFGESALFLFFKGRVHRLKCNIPAALKAYELAIDKSPQREIQLLSLHEVGWCYLIQLDWANSYQCFNQLRHKSRWSKSFYTYLSVVCMGASGDLEYALKITEDVLEHETGSGSSTSSGSGDQGQVNNKNTLELFIYRRVNKFKHAVVDQVYYKLLAFELLYLWNALPSCGPSQMLTILEDCKSCNSEPIKGLSELIQAAVYSCSSDNESAISYFKSCIETRSHVTCGDLDDPGDGSHVSAFALFECAMLLIQDEQTVEEGKSLLLRAQNDYKGYDFENRLNIRIHSALRKLG